MALIKCPECGKDVSTAAEVCPHCGYPINKANTNKESLDSKQWPKPINSSWTNFWKRKMKRQKLAFFLVFLIFTIYLFIIFPPYLRDEFTNESIDFIVWSSLYADIFFFAFWIASLITIRIKIRTFDGYTVLVLNGIRNYLVIENKIIRKTLLDRYIDGVLPNGKTVKAAISIWDGSIDISLGTDSIKGDIL